MRRGSANEAAIAAVAEHFGASLVQSAHTRARYLNLGSKRVAIDALALEAKARNSRSVPPRLRFDRVVLRVLLDLRTGLCDVIPDGRTVTVTITAPIRVPAKTVATLQERIQGLLGRRSARAAMADTIHGNEVRARVMEGGTGSTSKLVGFVHNRDSDPAVLFDVTQALLAGLGPAKRTGDEFSGDRWLIISFEDEPSWLQTYGHVCSQLFPRKRFQRIVLVDADGCVSPWAE